MTAVALEPKPAQASPRTKADPNARVRRLVSDELRASAYPPLRKLECEVEDGRITLLGTVTSYHLKQLAQAAASNLGGSRNVRNLVRVRTMDDRELEDRMLRFLRLRGVPGCESVRIEAAGGIVTVAGRLPTASAKAMCLACCRHVAGAMKVLDEVDVAENCG